MKNNEKKMFGYKVNIEKSRDHYEHDGEQFGAWSASSSHSIDTVVLKTTEYPDITSSIDFQMGDIAFVVWAVWSSGDSFGHESGASSEALGIFKDAKAAFELKNFIESKKWNDDHTLDFKTSDGQQIKSNWVGWSGYFESLDYVEITTVLVNEKE